MVVTAGAVSVLPGQWERLLLDDGTEVWAELTGDEMFHYWLTGEGQCYVLQEGCYVQQPAEKVRQRQLQRQQERRARGRQQAFNPKTYLGERRCMLLLVDFPDCHFQEGHGQKYYEQMCNTPGYTTDEGYRGSVYDYFYEQSYGQFKINFDVTPVVTMPNGYAYYGRDRSSTDIDIRLNELIDEACLKGTEGLDLADYDWDGDGEIDQVVILYAGNGQTGGGGEDAIWPQEWTLTDMVGRRLQVGDYYVDTYSCVAELHKGRTAGIGTLCHEFAHTLGLADMYDTRYNGNFGLGLWSLMDRGNYSGNGFVPTGFTAFERMSCGWLTPVELTTDTLIDNMQPLSLVPEAYLVRNDEWPDEFYLLENRQPLGWDAELPGKGILIFHIDYDSWVWKKNEVNVTSTESVTKNDHLRCTIFTADNSRQLTVGSMAGDTYPSAGNGNDSLTAYSQPAAMWYHAAEGGNVAAHVAFTDIRQHDDWLMSFRFRAAPDPAVGMADAERDKRLQSVYTLSGQYAGTSLSALPRGVYVVGKRKIIR